MATISICNLFSLTKCLHVLRDAAASYDYVVAAFTAVARSARGLWLEQSRQHYY